MTMPSNGMLTKIAASVAAGAALMAAGGLVAWGRTAEKVEANSEANEQSHTNAVAIAKITQWIEVDRDRTEREHKENVKAHEKILDKLDEIQGERK